MTRRVVVIGGGIAGLTAAYRIVGAARHEGLELDVRVLEASEEPGGKIQSERHGEWLCETGPNGFLDNEPATLRLVQDLGLDDRLQRSTDEARRRFLVRDGRLVEMHMHPVKFLRSPLLSRRAKLRMGMELFQKPKLDDRDESVGDFGRRRLGSEFTRIMLDSMVSGIYAGDVDRLSVKAAFPKIVDLEQEHGGLFKGMFARQKEKRRERKAARARGETPSGEGGVQAGPAGVLHSFDEGMQVPIDTLADVLGPERVRTNAAAARVTRQGERFEVVLADGERLEADAVVSTIPARAASEILREIAPAAADALSEIHLAGVHVVCLGYPREAIEADTRAFGALIPRGEGIRTLGTIFSSSTFEDRAPEGHVLLTNMIGGRHDPQANELDDDALVEQVRSDLGPILGLQGEPELVQVYRWSRGIPQYEIGHLERVERAEAAARESGGLFLAGNSVSGVSFNHCILRAESLADEVLDHLLDRPAVDAASAAEERA